MLQIDEPWKKPDTKGFFMIPLMKYPEEANL